MWSSVRRFSDWSSKRFWSAVLQSESATLFQCPLPILERLALALPSQRPANPKVGLNSEVTFCVRGVSSPLLSNLYLNEVDKMLERAKDVTRQGRYHYIEYARFADDLVILIDGYRRWRWLETTVYKRLLEELATLDAELNRDKTRRVDLAKGESFTFLGFSIRRVRTQRGKWGVACVPKIAARTKLLRRLKGVMGRHCSQPVERVIALINPILRGWTNYFRIGQSSRCFSHVKDWVEKKVRRHLMRQRGRLGFGWKRWSRQKLYDRLGLFSEYRVVYLPKALPV